MQNSNADSDAHLPNFELPDWGGMDDLGSRQVDVATAFRLCEEYFAIFADESAKWHTAHNQIVDVEFVL